MVKIECRSLYGMSDEEIKAEIEDGFAPTDPEDQNRPPVVIQGQFHGRERFRTVVSFHTKQGDDYFQRARRPGIVVLWNHKTGEPYFASSRDVSQKLTPSEFPKGEIGRIPEIYKKLNPYQGPSLRTTLKKRTGLWS